MKTKTEPTAPPKSLKERLEKLLETEEKRLTLEDDPTKRQTQLRTITMLLGELRKAEKGEVDAVKKLSHASVMLWAKTQTVEGRARLVREVSALDAVERRSVLG